MGSESNRPQRAELAELVDALRGSLRPALMCLSHSWGGLEQVACDDALEMARLGLAPRFVCLKGSPVHEQLISRGDGLSVVPLEFRPRNHFDFKLRRVLGGMIGEGTNLLHSHQTSLLGSVTPWLWSKPAVAAFASRHIMNRHDKRNPLHRAIYGRLDALIVMSDALRANILATHPLKEKQVKVVNLGLDFDRFDPARAQPAPMRESWGARAEDLVIGLVGRIDPAKGQATFIRAAAGLLKSAPEGTRLKFVIVGEETRGRQRGHLDELKAMVSEFRLGDSVVFSGFHENVPDVMRALDVFVMPSRQEAFGLVAIEAMAMERPVVISSGGSSLEIVGEDQSRGLLVRPDDAFDLQAQLRRLVEGGRLRHEMGARARQHVLANYSKALRMQRTLELYERAIRRRGVCRSRLRSAQESGAGE